VFSWRGAKLSTETGLSQLDGGLVKSADSGRGCIANLPVVLFVEFPRDKDYVNANF